MEGNNDNWKLEKKLKQRKSRKAVRVSVKSVRRFIAQASTSVIKNVMIFYVFGP